MVSYEAMVNVPTGAVSLKGLSGEGGAAFISGPLVGILGSLLAVVGCFITLPLWAPP